MTNRPKVGSEWVSSQNLLQRRVKVEDVRPMTTAPHYTIVRSLILEDGGIPCGDGHRRAYVTQVFAPKMDWLDQYKQESVNA